MSVCPLCSCRAADAFASVRGRDYLICGCCDLVWLTPDQRPGRDEEFSEYLLHENDPGNAGYRRHLSRLMARLLPHVPPGARGLDFGCGPGPAISEMLGEAGFAVENYDPFFADEPALLDGQYDFITATEVAEHLHDPQAVFAQLARMLKPGGVLGLMTQLRTQDIAFDRWRYITERSHVTFYSPRTLEWIARRFSWKAQVFQPDVVIFRDGS